MENGSTLASMVLRVVRNCEPHDFAMELKDKIRVIRSRLSLTQDQMAERLGLTSDSRRARISEWEAGRGEPKRNVLIRYSELANIELRKLIDDRETLDS